MRTTDRSGDGDQRLIDGGPGDHGQVSRAEIVLAVAAVLAGSVLRFTPATPMWLDEALTVNIAGGELGSIGELLRRDGHPPLYYFLQSWWIDLFGSGDVAVRSLSGVISVATIGLTFVVTRSLLGPRAAIGAVAIVSMSPFAIRYGGEARMYSLAFALALGGILLVTRAIERPVAARLAPVAVVSGALMLTHYWSFFLLAVVFGLLVLRSVRAPHADERWAARRVAVAVAAGGVLFLPWLPGFLDQLGSTGTPWAPRPLPTALVSETVLGLSGGLSAESIILGVVLGSTWALGLFTRRSGRAVVVGLTANRVVRRLGLVTITTVVFGAVVSYVGDSAFVARYAAVYLPLIMLTVAAGIARLPLAAVRAALLGLIVLLGTAATVHDLRSDRSQAEQIAAEILDRGGAGDVVVYCPDQLGPATSRALGDAPLEQFTFNEFDDPRLVDWVDYADRYEASDPDGFAAELVDRTPATARIFVVWSDSYRVVDDRCSALVDAVAARRSGGQQVASGDAGRYFEHASLHVFPPEGG